MPSDTSKKQILTWLSVLFSADFWMEVQTGQRVLAVSLV
jgi:hypothetical protein